MNKIKVVIPSSVGETISDEVINSINGQSTGAIIKIIKNPVRYSQLTHALNERIKIISESRTMCLPFLMEDEISVMQDRRVMHNKMTNFQEMHDVLMSDPNIMAVALPLAPVIDLPKFFHIKNGCIMARKKVWQTVNFNSTGNTCTCTEFCKQVRNLGIYRVVDKNMSRAKIL